MPFWSRSRDELAPDRHVVVGLGNPGSQYANTRHNVGAEAIRFLASQHNVRLQRSKHAADVAHLRLAGVPVVLAVPETYMNESGVAVSRLVRYYKVPLDRLLVVCDDMDVPFGTIRLRPGGSSGGNRGLRSIISYLGTQEFPRMRLGIGRPERGAVDHVLGRFSDEQERLLPRFYGVVTDAVAAVLADGVNGAMNRFNRDWLPALVESETPSQM